MTSVDGDYAPPVPGTPQGVPSSFGGNVDLASAFEGTLSDMRAVAQQTIRTLSDIGVMAQRVSSMLGGTAGGSMAAPPIPNQVPQLFGSNTSSANVAAAISQASGASYGSAANASPQWNPSYAMMPPAMVNPAFDSMPSGGFLPAGPTAQPVPNQVPPSPADAPSPGQPGWAPASPSDDKRDADIQKIKHFTEAALGGEFLHREGSQEAGQVKSLAQNPSVLGITQTLATKLSATNFAQGRIMKPWEQLPDSVQAKFITGAAGGSDVEGTAALADAVANGAPAETGVAGAIGSLAGGGGFAEAAGALAGGGAMATAGLVAAPVAAALLGLHEMESQRAENAQIQSQIGGSNWAAFGTRAQGAGFGLSQMGTMSMGMANQAFTGVTDLGLQGGSRSNALNFIVGNYTSMGMSISDSLALVSASVKTGTANLQQLAGVLDNVTQSAQQAGINTDAARQSFAAMFQSAVTGGGMNATQGAIYAGAQQNLFSQLGQAGVGLTAASAPVGLLAAESGLTPGQAAAQTMGPNGANWTAAQQQKAISQITSGTNAMAGYTPQQIANAAKGRGLTQFMAQMPGGPQQMIGVLTSPAFGMSASQLQGLSDSKLAQLYAQRVQQGALTNAVSVSSSMSAIGAYANNLSAIAGQGAESQANVGQDQTAGYDLKSINTWVAKNKANPAQAAALAAVLIHGGKGTVNINGQHLSVWDALNNQGDIGQIAAGHGTYTGTGGHTQSLSSFIAAHRQNQTPKSPTAANQSGKGSGTVTIGLTPAAAALAQIVGTSGAAQPGNNYGSINTPPVGIPVFTGN